ncbi:MAG: hypothetical protein NTZ32_23700 [Planctomycetales bacterium]|nr:hypothetical protein [Planctomycetales bacterium]
MSQFRAQSKSLLRNVSKAATWMMSRHVGPDHFWRSTVLTATNPDNTKRPVFDQTTADSIFKELIDRELLVRIHDNFDGTAVPTNLMRYDIEGWDQAVADGRPVYGFFLKVCRNWLLILLTFLFGCVVTTIENRTVGVFDKAINLFVSSPDQRQDNEGAEGKLPDAAQPVEGANKAVNQSGGSGGN